MVDLNQHTQPRLSAMGYDKYMDALSTSSEPNTQ